MAPGAFKRHFLRENEAKRIVAEFSKSLKMASEELLGSKPDVEIAEVGTDEVFIINGEPAFAKSGERFFPTLVFEKLLRLLPKVVVDMGAVPHICNGADVMAPGVLHIEGDFNKQEFVLIADEHHGKPLAIGIALFDSRATENRKQGKIVKTIHHVGDKLWDALKKI